MTKDTELEIAKVPIFVLRDYWIDGRITSETYTAETKRRGEAFSSLIDALHECEEYFDNRADADCDQDGYIPNAEMRLLQVVRDALRKAGAE